LGAVRDVASDVSYVPVVLVWLTALSLAGLLLASAHAVESLAVLCAGALLAPASVRLLPRCCYFRSF